MSYEYASRKQGKQSPQREPAPARPSLDALRSGAALPTREQMGRRVDLPDAMRAKMEDAFGADLSAVKLYESETVADAGAEAVTQGTNIAFAPGMLDFSSFGGQALLGHELSHVVSQSRGEVAGGGFLNDRALEARADREGAMAAAGQQIAMPAAALSPVSAAPAAAPMQASKKSRLSKQYDDVNDLNGYQSLEHMKYGKRDGKLMPYTYDPSIGRTRWVEVGSMSGEQHQARMASWDRQTGNRMTSMDAQSAMRNFNMQKVMDASVALSDRHQSEYSGSVKDTWKNDLELDSENFNGGTLFNHLSAAANAGGDENTTYEDRRKDFDSMMETLSSGDKDKQDEMMLKIKGNYMQYLKRLEGSIGTDFHKESAWKLSRNGRYKELSNALGADSAMPLMFATQYGHLFDEKNEEDQEYLRLARYFHSSKKAMDSKVAPYIK